MPIKHIQTRLSNRQFNRPPFPEWGNIGKGTKATAQSGKLYPVETPHYNFTYNAGFEDLAPYITSLYGDKPMILDVFLYAMKADDNPVERVMPTSMQSWAQSKHDPNKRTLMYECDGEVISRVWNNTSKQHDRNPTSPCGYDPDTRTCKHGCKETARLFVILPALCETVGTLGYFTMTLHGTTDIMNLSSVFTTMGERVTECLWRFERVQATTRYPDATGAMKERQHYPIQASVLNMQGGLGAMLGAMTNAPQIADSNADVNNRAGLLTGGDVFPLGSDIPDDMGYTGVVYEEYEQPTPQPAPQPNNASSTLATVLSITGATESQVLEVLGFRTWDNLKQGFGKLYPTYWLRDENGAYLPMSQDLLAQAIAQAYKDSL